MGVARRRPLPPLLLLPLLLAPPAILLCGGSRAAAVEVGTFGPWTGCVLSADVLGGNDTVFEVSGVIQFAGMDPPPTLVRVGDDAPFLSGSVRVGLEFGGKEARPGADCSALLAEESEPVTGLRLLPPSEPLSTVPDPIVVWVSAGPLDNLAKVSISGSLVALEDLQSDRLELQSDGVFKGTLVTKIIGGTANVEMLMMPPMESEIVQDGEVVASKTVQIVKIDRQYTEQGTIIRLSIPDLSASFPVTLDGGISADVTVSGRLAARSDPQPAPTPTAAPLAKYPLSDIECASPLVYNQMSDSCACPDGRAGASCAVCTSDAGCETGSCNQSLPWMGASTSKSFTCTPVGASAALVNSIELQCSTSGALPASFGTVQDADPDLGFCAIQVSLELGQAVEIVCSAYNCEMPAGFATTQCQRATCSCPSGCQGLDVLISGLSSAGLACDNSGSCNVILEGLPLPSIPVNCSASGCMESKPSARNGQGVSPAISPSGPSVDAVAPPLPSPKPALPARPSPPPITQETEKCKAPQKWDSRTQKCICAPGLLGTTCGVCTTDNACGDSATCDASFTYSSATSTKNFICSSEDPTISKIVKSLDFQCTTSGLPPSSLDAVKDLNPDLSFCGVQVGLALPGLRPIQVSCTAYNCAIRLDSSTTDCRGVKCDCSDGSCQGLDSLVDQLDSAAIDCQETGACNITIGGLPITKFPVTCLSGECVVASATGNFQGNYVEESDLDWDRIGIACIGFLPTAVMVVVLALAALLARASMTCTCAPRLRGSLLQSDIKLLSFQGLTVTVPQKRAMRRESGDAGPRTEGTGSEGPIPVAESILASSPSSYHSNKGFQNVDLALDEEAGASFSSKRPAPSAAGRRRQILSGVTFTAQRGEVLAIMGPSGSGKTTLLSILAAREGDLGNGALVEGAILIDGVKRKQRTFRSTCAFVPQDDALFPSLTVHEAVSYSARLRLFGRQPEELAKLVDQTLRELRLSHIAGSRIGTPAVGGGGRGVSGGERRRVSIAMEMVIQPSIIMLDEPTSGLDSFAAGSLMSRMKEIAAGGRIVIMTLHQPSPNAFLKLDRVLLLANGCKVFSGTPHEVEEFFDSASFPCEHGMPIADHMLHVVSQADCLDQILALSGSSNATVAVGGVRVCSADDEQEGPSYANGPHHPGFLARTRAALLELDVLLWRGATNLWRNPTLLLMHSLVAALMGVGMGMVFLGVDDSLAGLQNKAGGVFFTLAFFAFCSLTTVDSFLAERAIVLRETQSGYYSAASYLLIKVMLDSLLLRVLPAALFGLPFYYLMGLADEPERVAVFFAVLTTFSATAGALSMAASVGCPTAGTANLVMTLLLLTSLVFGGFLANLEVMPDWISWIGYMSIFRYAFEALVVNEVTGSAFNLDVGGYQLDGLDNQLLLDVLGLNKDRFLVNAIVLDAMFVCFLLLAGIILYVILPKHSRRKTWACWLSSLRLGRRSITRQGSVHVPTTSRRAPLAATVASEGTACDLDGASPMAVELSVVQGE